MIAVHRSHAITGAACLILGLLVGVSVNRNPVVLRGPQAQSHIPPLACPAQASPAPTAAATAATADWLDLQCVRARQQLQHWRRDVNASTPAVSPAAMYAALEPCLRQLRGAVYVYGPELAGVDLFHFGDGWPLSRFLDAWDHEEGEFYLIHLLLQSEYVTHDPSAAKLFVIPHFPVHELYTCMLTAPNWRTCSPDTGRISTSPALDAVMAGRWWQRYGGVDHVMIWGYDSGLRQIPDPSIEQRLFNATLLEHVYTPDRQAEEKDVIFPAVSWFSWEAESTMEGLLRARAPGLAPPARWGKPGQTEGCDRNRSILGSFRGTIHPERQYSGGVRQDLLEAYGGKADARLHITRVMDRTAFIADMRESHFCLCPPGWSWTSHIYAALNAGCPPVIYDTYTLPFEDVVPWHTFSLRIPPGRHMDTETVLDAVLLEDRCRMRRRLAQLFPWLVWSAAPMNVLDMTLAHVAYKVTRRLLQSPAAAAAFTPATHAAVRDDPTLVQFRPGLDS